MVRDQSPRRPLGLAAAGISSFTSASAMAPAQALAPASGSRDSVGVGMDRRDGGGCDRRVARAPGRPRKGWGRSPHPGSASRAARMSDGRMPQRIRPAIRRSGCCCGGCGLERANAAHQADQREYDEEQENIRPHAASLYLARLASRVGANRADSFASGPRLTVGFGRCASRPDRTRPSVVCSGPCAIMMPWRGMKRRGTWGLWAWAGGHGPPCRKRLA